MEFNDLLIKHALDPREALVLRHRPIEPRLNEVFPWLAAEKPELFNAFQQTHGPRLEKAMTTAKFVASFLGRSPGQAIFVGLYRVGAHRPLTLDQYWQVPAHIEMKAYGFRGFTGEDGRDTILWFDLERCDFYREWEGRLVIGWPGLERSWWRWADRNKFPILVIREESAFVERMPEWPELDLSWDQLGVLPASWKSALREWRGIYLIFDAQSGKGYVGAAYGEANVLGRWLAYAASGHGGNRLLKDRDPKNFRFSILQRLSPDLPADEVVRVEGSWKKRLHTQAPFGLNDN